MTFTVIQWAVEIYNVKDLPFCRSFSCNGKTDSVASFACGGVPVRNVVISLHKFAYNLLHKLDELIKEQLMKRILVVDNDKNFRSSMFEAFKGPDYDVVTAENSLWAINFLKTLKIDLVICDLRIMPEGGYELLSQIKEEYPQVIRIIMSDSAEEASALKAILQNIARFYILKPLKNEKLLEYVGQIFDTEELLKSNDLLHLVNNVEKLPTIESSYQNILNMIERDADIGAISLEIEKDFAISSKLLRIANSAYLRTPDRFRQACHRLFRAL